MFAFLQVFLERIGCFSVEKELINLLRNQKAPFERSNFVQACGSVAWSRGLRVFAVHNGSDCLGYLDVSATLPRLNVSQGCLGGRGGQNVTDVYRFTSKKALPHSTDLTNGQFLHQLLFTLCSLITYIRHAFIPSPIEPFAHTFFAWSLRINESMNKSINQSFFHSFSQSIICVSIYSLGFFFCFFFSLSLVLLFSFRNQPNRTQSDLPDIRKCPCGVESSSRTLHSRLQSSGAKYFFQSVRCLERELYPNRKSP